MFPGRFDRDRGRWTHLTGVGGEHTTDELTLVTFNVWFGEYYASERYRALFRILRDCAADVIALQEVTPDLLSLVLEEEWIRQEYFCSDIMGVTVMPYGVLVLSRIPFRRITAHELPSLMNRSVVMADYSINQKSLRVASVHLESLRPSADIRAQQLEIIFPLLEAPEASVLMGDFNFCSSWEEENRNIDDLYQDLWPVLRDGEPGYTEDADVNRMRFKLKGKMKQVRFDRILLRSGGRGWRPESIRLLGNEPVADDLPDVFPSDHFGLCAKLRWYDEE